MVLFTEMGESRRDWEIMYLTLDMLGIGDYQHIQYENLSIKWAKYYESNQNLKCCFGSNPQRHHEKLKEWTKPPISGNREDQGTRISSKFTRRNGEGREVGGQNTNMYPQYPYHMY